MITGHTVEKLNSGLTPSQMEDGQEGKTTASKPVTIKNTDGTDSQPP